MALVDMKRSAADMRSTVSAMPADSTGQYPYGLNICLDKDELDKLGITKLAEIGAEFHGIFVAQVTRISQSADMQMNDESMSMSLQITMLDINEEEPHQGESTETLRAEVKELRTLLTGL